MILAEVIKNLEVPTSALEDWRYTPVRKILAEDYSFDEPQLELPEDPSWFDPNFYNFIFINGFYQKDLSHPGRLNFAFAATENHNSKNNTSDFFLKVSEDFAKKEINFAINHSPTRPLRFLFLSTGTKIRHCSLPRLNIQIAVGVQVDFVEEFRSEERHGLSIDFFKVQVADDASVRWYSLNFTQKAWDEKNRRLHYLSVDLAKNACLEHFYLCFGSQFIRSQLNVNLQEHAKAVLKSANLLTQNAHVDLQTRVFHQGINSHSEQNYKTLVKNKSRFVFRGEIKIDHGAKNAVAKQKNQNVKLSPESEINTQPVLNINCNEVQCSHGATVSGMREEDIFYMQSRGISPNDARILLGRSFLLEPVLTMEDSKIKNLLIEMVKAHAELLA